MSVIYEPKGRALEYSELACNLFTGCPHACKYCYAPGVMHKKKADYHRSIEPRPDILHKLRKDCKKMAGDPREVLLCFGCDPYPTDSPGNHEYTRAALIILERFNMKATVLTKAGMVASRDFGILKRNGWSFGTTMIFSNDETRQEWEPKAASLESRMLAIMEAHKMGIKTWLSVEPVIDPDQAIAVIAWARASGAVSHIKVGKLNHMYYKNESRDWKAFLEAAEKVLGDSDYYIKKDLWEAAGRTWVRDTSKRLWEMKYILRLRLQAELTYQEAKLCYDAGRDCHDYGEDPFDAADEELSCWGD